jgi:phosphoribosylamine--glycine ligase
MRLKSDLVDLLEHAIHGARRRRSRWDRRAALGVVLAAAGYRGRAKATRSKVSIGSPKRYTDVHVFHAVPLANDVPVVTGGGCCVTALGDSVRQRSSAYAAVAEIRFGGSHLAAWLLGHRAIAPRKP